MQRLWGRNTRGSSEEQARCSERRGRGWQGCISRDSRVPGQSWAIPSSCCGQPLEDFKQRVMRSDTWFKRCSLAALGSLDLQHCQGWPAGRSFFVITLHLPPSLASILASPLPSPPLLPWGQSTSSPSPQKAPKGASQGPGNNSEEPCPAPGPAPLVPVPPPTRAGTLSHSQRCLAHSLL